MSAQRLARVFRLRRAVKAAWRRMLVDGTRRSMVRHFRLVQALDAEESFESNAITEVKRYA